MRNPKSYRFTSWLLEFTFFRLTPHRSKAKIPAYRDALRLTVFFLSLSPLLLCTPVAVHAQWEPDVRLTFDADSSLLSNNNARCLAASGDTVHVVWYDRRDGNWEIYYKRSSDAGSTWGSDTSLTASPDTSKNPSIAVSGSTVHLVWQDHRDGNWEIYYKTSTDGGSSWGSDIRLTADTMQSRSPSLSVLDSMIQAVWSTDFSYLCYKRSTNSGMTWTPDTNLGRGGTPCLALSGTSLHLMYDGGMNIYYRRSTDMGLTWSDSTILAMGNIYPFEMNNQPSVSVTGSNVHGVWEYYWQFSSRWYCAINYRKSADEGLSWLFGSQISSGVFSLSRPVICASDSNIHVAWCDGRSGVAIYYRRSHDGGSNWEPETRLTSGSVAYFSPFLAVQGPKVHVVWTDSRDGNFEIYYKRNFTGNGVEIRDAPIANATFRPLKVIPNPFLTFATLPGHEAVRFALYDISGRRVGTYRGDRVGADLTPGVYFIKPEEKQSKPLRIVKLR